MKRILLLAAPGVVVLLAVLLSCNKQDTGGSVVNCPPGTTNASVPMNTDESFSEHHKKLNWRTLWELLQARAASAKYRNINNAIRDGYADISVVVPNMGYHYMKSALVDSVFDIRHPELLVYNKNAEGQFELQAVEYAVPLDKSVNAPQGFTGNDDVWDHNDGFGLWLLHAWVWRFNPDGVFHPTNSSVHVH